MQNKAKGFTEHVTKSGVRPGRRPRVPQQMAEAAHSGRNVAFSLLLCVVQLMVRHRSIWENAHNGEVGDPDPACCCQVYTTRAKFVLVSAFTFLVQPVLRFVTLKGGESQLTAADLKLRERSALEIEFQGMADAQHLFLPFCIWESVWEEDR